VTAPGPARILVVEDDPEVRELLQEHLTGLGHETLGVASAH
jgi:CheY-like chemotaxis protein